MKKLYINFKSSKPLKYFYKEVRLLGFDREKVHVKTKNSTPECESSLPEASLKDCYDVYFSIIRGGLLGVLCSLSALGFFYFFYDDFWRFDKSKSIPILILAGLIVGSISSLLIVVSVKKAGLRDIEDKVGQNDHIAIIELNDTSIIKKIRSLVKKISPRSRIKIEKDSILGGNSEDITRSKP